MSDEMREWVARRRAAHAVERQARRDKLAALLADHAFDDVVYGYATCRCGWSADNKNTTHAQHQADIVLAANL